jgi:type IV pilus assembly protein PilC
VHESVKEGETITAPLEASGVFPPMVISMVDVGEQTGALPEMLLKIADNYDEEVDNAVESMTSLLEPIMIIFLAVIVGSIVIAMFLPLIAMITVMSGGGKGGGDRQPFYSNPEFSRNGKTQKLLTNRAMPCVNTL